LEFFCLTPLPGSEDHKNLFLKGVPMDPDMNRYDLEHVCTGHPIMSAEAWAGVYRDAWRRYYTDQHVETVLRRAVASGLNPKKIVDALTIFSGSVRIEGVHPLQFGFVRRKSRTSRRHGLPIENPLLFYPRRTVEAAVVLLKWLKLVRRYRKIMAGVIADPKPPPLFGPPFSTATPGGGGGRGVPNLRPPSTPSPSRPRRPR